MEVKSYDTKTVIRYEEPERNRRALINNGYATPVPEIRAFDGIFFCIYILLIDHGNGQIFSLNSDRKSTCVQTQVL